MSDLNESLALSEELLAFIKQSPSMFHTTQTIKEYLLENGFTYLSEGSSWDIQPGGSYFTTRNNSSIVAWKVGEKYREPKSQALMLLITSSLLLPMAILQPTR